MTELEKD